MDGKPSAPPGAPPAPGLVIGGRYALEALVAQGGMGAIYAARDRRLGRRVAVKMLLGAAEDSPDFAERFGREARAASSINHPNCVVVHDSGVDEGGHYLVMEWVEGRTLAALVAGGGPLSPERAAALMAQVCDGLGAAHAHGIIHRDVKPENVMVVPTPGGGELAKLVDFGIARAFGRSSGGSGSGGSREGEGEAGAGGDPQLTQVGFAMGTPRFMSPEQATLEELDARTDVYSAGATLYFALSGRAPYLGDRLAVVRQLVHGPPPEPPASLQDHPLAAVVKRAMARDRDARPASAAELGRLIREAASARGPRRGRAVALALVAAALAGAAVLGNPLEATAEQPRLPGLEEVEALLSAGRPADAEQVLQGRLQGSPDDARLLLLMGHIRAARGDEAGARATYTAALRARVDLAGDATLQRNAVEWLRRPNTGPQLELWRALGQAGLPALRRASTSREGLVRWNAIRLRQQVGDTQPPDLVAAYLLDLEAARDCDGFRAAADRLRVARDRRALEPLKAARAKLSFWDALCAGGALDEAIRAVGAAPAQGRPKRPASGPRRQAPRAPASPGPSPTAAG